MPPSHESGLAVSGRCGHDNDRKDAVQYVAGRIKPRPGQRLPRPGGGKQLALDYRVHVSFAVHTVECVVRVVVIRTYLTPNFGWVQLEPLQGNVDPRRLAWTSQKMADSNHITSNPPAQRANPQRELPDGTLGVISLGPAPICRGTAGGGEGNCPLWDGQITDATFPLL